MKITLQTLLESQIALAQLCAKPWPHSQIKTSYALSKTLKAIISETNDFNQHRDALIRQYGDEIGGGEWRVKPESIAICEAAIKSLLAVECEITAPSITVNQLCAAEMALAPNDFLALSWLISGEE